MGSHRTRLAVAAVVTAVALVGCTGESSSQDTPTSSADGTTASSTSPGGTATPTSPEPGTTSSGATTSTPPSSSSKTATPEGPAPTGSSSSGAGQPGSPHTTGSGSADKTPSGPTLTLKVEGAAKLKVTKITVKGTLTQTVQSPATLTVSVDPSLKIGYTITAVALSGTIDSCTVTTPKGTTKPVTPSSGACTTTYTPGG